MGWFFALLLVATLVAAWWVHHRRMARRWRQLETMVHDIAGGGEPRPYLFDGDSRFARLAGQLEMLADEQELMRRRRLQQEENFRIILASMDEGVMVTDSQHAIRLVNPSFRRLFGLSTSAFGEKVLTTLCEPLFDEMITLALTTAQPQEREVMVSTTTPPRHFAVHVAPMRDAIGELGVVAMFRDVTRLKQLEEVRREFVANVSHELRTPLSIFQGYVETLLDADDLPREDLVSILGVMKKHSQRLNALVDDLLSLARLEARDSQLERAPLPVEEFLRGVAQDWAHHARQKNIGIEVEACTPLPPLMADESQLAEVCNNLVENALKYTPPNGRIKLRAEAVNGHLELRVEDTGVGIPSADLPHIFERFYRADKARSREQGGTGLGLSIVKHIVQAHGGSVSAQSEPGTGTNIVLQFPL